MGLDMYLEKRSKYTNDQNTNEAIDSFISWIRDGQKYGSNYTFKQWCGCDYTDLPDIKTLIQSIENHPLDPEEREVYYWRKANAIHKWFVDNIQNGIDNCEYHRPVTKEDLLKLSEVCEKVLSNHELAKELLPAMPGFFFGSYEYDEDYFEYVEETAELCKKLTEDGGFDFENYELYYLSSW